MVMVMFMCAPQCNPLLFSYRELMALWKLSVMSTYICLLLCIPIQAPVCFMSVS